MALSVNWPTGVITVPKADLTLVTGTLYELDVDAFRLELKSLEDDEAGMPWPRTHHHNTEVTIAGVTYARLVEILSPYSVEFEDGAYSVRLAGANNNIFDVENGILVQNTVQVIAQNSAGLISITSGSGLSATEAARLRDIWRILGLDTGSPMTVTQDEQTAGDITLDLTGDGITTKTVTRQ